MIFLSKLLNFNILNFVIFSSANKCLLKVAMYSAQMEEYAKALEIYEQVRILFKMLSLYPTNCIIWSLNCKLAVYELLQPHRPKSDQLDLRRPYTVTVMSQAC